MRSKYQMDMVFIQKTKIRRLEDRVVETLWGGEKMSWFGVDAEESSGGLITIWDPDFLQPINKVKGKGFVLVRRKIMLNQQKILMNFLNVYAPILEKEKMLLWESLVALKSNNSGVWVIGGDFYSVLSEEERNRSSFNEKDASLFQDFTQAMEVLDLPLVGRCFTWGNKNGTNRLDRFLISPGILSYWPKIVQVGLEKGPSNHTAVLLGVEQTRGGKASPYKKRLAKVRSMLSKWNKKSFGDVRAKLIKTREEWERLQDSRILSEEEILRKIALQKVIWLLEVQDERICRQKSRISWLRLGYQNTSFFHRMATWRSKKNSISSILVDDKWADEPGLIKQTACAYFSGIFRRAAPCRWFLEELSFSSLNDDQRVFLERDISEEEILLALKDCDGNKAPGPDIFNINFYKKFWLMVGDEVVGFIKEFCVNGRLSRGINKTYLALIPKSVNPHSFAVFRPISLVNSMYKILSKCLARRLSSVLPQIISPNQSAFITDRNILDDIMIVNELIHAVKKEKRSAIVKKLDFKKAYDSVSWEYLRSIQASMGFGAKWMGWMSECYSSVSLSILINGSPTKEIFMERGLRQGDPLSPLLFLMAVEGLSRILNNVVQKGRISGVEWVRNRESLTHLQFADDTVLFCKPDMQEVWKIRHIIISFAVCSRLEINFNKSRCLGIGLEDEEVQKFADVLGSPMGKFPMNYLGMQVGANPSRISTWSPILQKFKQKLASWKSTNLSMAGRVVLIKSVLCNLPLYYASMYKMPITVAQEMERTQRRFLWGSSDLRRKIHYVKWSKITKPKKYGGLGIQGLVNMNLTLLAKWWWKLVTGKGGLWRRMVLEKYDFKKVYDPSDISIAPKKLSNSWKDIIKIAQENSEVALALKEGLKLKLGNGQMTSFWHDVWLGDKSIKAQYPKLFLLAMDNKASVQQMGCWIGGVWHWELKFRRILYQWEEVNRRELEESLKHIQLKDREDDRIVWSFSADGNFSKNSLMKAAMAIRKNKKKWEQVPFQLWSGLAPPKLEMLIWRIYVESFPTKLALPKRRVLRREEDLVCVLCDSEQESTDHLLIHCVWS
ncbi:hypothetical protein QQ045_020172 [Rhodiola kirilowii]